MKNLFWPIVALLPVACLFFFVYYSQERKVRCNGPQPPNSIRVPVIHWNTEDFGGWSCTQVEKSDYSDFTSRYECGKADGSGLFSVQGDSIFPVICKGDGTEKFLKTRSYAGLYSCDSPNHWAQIPGPNQAAK